MKKSCFGSSFENFMTLKQIRLTIIVLILMLVSGWIGYQYGTQGLPIPKVDPQKKIILEKTIPPKYETVDFSLFWTVWDKLETDYLNKSALDREKMIYGAISGMVQSLEDPYTVFLPPGEQKLSKEDLSGVFEGVGIQLGFKDNKIAVIAPLSGSPAEKADVKAGDFILKIKDDKKKIEKETMGMALPEAVNIIRGQKGTPVFLTLTREGKSEPFEVKLVRDKIVVKSVELSFVGNAAVLKLLRFGDRTNQEWEDQVGRIESKIKKGETRGVVLDLRNNPGGYLQGAIFIASEFFKDGDIVKQEKTKNGGTQTFSVNRKGKLTEIPLIVLVNGGSASASEIVAGVLKERGRAKIVGEKTFGKGTVQEAEELSGGSGLHVTVARWLIPPRDKSIDKEGIIPDFEVKMEPVAESDENQDVQLEKAIELLK